VGERRHQATSLFDLAGILTDLCQYLTILDTVFTVHLQDQNCRAAGWCATLDPHISLNCKVFIPPLLTGVVQPGKLSRFWVKTDQIVTFVSIALMTCQAQVVEVIGAAMLNGDDVINVKGDCASGCGQTTVFTTVARAISDALPL
jgi:hypothetical protein